jgi:hypothetical protein
MPTGIQLSSGVVVGSPKPIDAKYGPYDTTALALADLSSGLRYQGLTVGIKSGNSVVEYWFKDGVDNSHFVEKVVAASISEVTGLETALGQKESRISFDIGGTTNANSVVNAGRNQIITFNSYNFSQNRKVTLPRSNDGAQPGDTLTFTHNAQFHAGGPWSVVLRQYEVVAPQGSPQYGTGFTDLITLADGETVELVAVGGGSTPVTWSIKNPSKHTHPASAISDSTAAGRALLLAANAQAQRDALDILVSVANFAALPTTGVAVSQGGSVYVTSDNGKVYVWNGTSYSEISPNVQANWNANSGDAQILNKPSSFPPSAHNHDDLYFNAAVPWTANHTLVDGTRYLAGDVVHSGGRIYRAKFDNESIPVTDPVYWQDLGPGNRLNIDGRDIANIPKADWNATSGDAEILNKPNVLTKTEFGELDPAFASTKFQWATIVWDTVNGWSLIQYYPPVENVPYQIIAACSNESSPLTTGQKLVFTNFFEWEFSTFRASVTEAPTGSSLIVHLRQGTNNLATVTIAAGTTHASSIDSMTIFGDQPIALNIFVQQVGGSFAGKGLKVYLEGTRPL